MPGDKPPPEPEPGEVKEQIGVRRVLPSVEPGTDARAAADTLAGLDPARAIEAEALADPAVLGGSESEAGEVGAETDVAAAEPGLDASEGEDAAIAPGPKGAMDQAEEGANRAPLADEDTRAALDDAGRARTRFGPEGGRRDGEEAADPELTARREQVDRMAQALLDDGAARVDDTLAFARGAIPARVDAAAAGARASIVAAAGQHEAAITGRIGQARDQVRSQAATARQTIHGAHDGIVSSIQARTAAALSDLEARRAAAMGEVAAQERARVTLLGELYAAGAQQYRGVGARVGQAATAKGAEYVRRYHAERIDRRDSLLDGYLTDRRAEARKKAARDVAKGYRDSLVEEADAQATNAAQGLDEDRTILSRIAHTTREALNSQYQTAAQGLRAYQDQAVAAAKDTRTRLLAAVTQTLSSSLRALDGQERSQRLAVATARSAQLATVGQAAAAATASLQGGALAAATSLQEALPAANALLADAPPDPDAVGPALAGTLAEVDGGLATLRADLDGGLARVDQQMAEQAAGAGQALAQLADSSHQRADEVSAGVTTAMTNLAAAANRAFEQQSQQHATTAQGMAQAAGDGLARQVAGLTRAYDQVTGGVRQRFADAAGQLEAALRDALRGMDSPTEGIPHYAEEAAAREQPAWKSVAKWVLIIAVVVVVAVVAGPAVIGAVGALAASLGAGAAAGAIGAIVGGAIVGAATAATVQVIDNWAAGRTWHEGTGKAALMGLIGGALGGGAGLLIGKAVSAPLLQHALEFASDAVLELGTQLVTTGEVDWASFGTSMLLSALTMGLGQIPAVKGVQTRVQSGVESRVRGGTERLRGGSRAGRDGPGGSPDIADAAASARALLDAELNAATTPAQVGAVDHTVTPRRMGGRLELWVCSAACGAVTAKIDDMLQALPASDTELRADLESLKAEVLAIEGKLATGQKSGDVVVETARIADRLQALGKRHPGLGQAIDEPGAIADAPVTAEPPSGGGAYGLGSGAGTSQKVPTSSYGDLHLAPGQDAVYILRDPRSGAVLKVGKTSEKAYPGRFTVYERAGRRLKMDLELEVIPVQTGHGTTAEAYESALRAHMESEGHIMPWDNTGNRLDHPDKGTPFEGLSSRSEYQWDEEGNLVKKDGKPVPRFERKNAAPTRQEVEHLLTAHRGDLDTIAKAKGVTYQAVWNWVKMHGIDHKSYQ